MYDHTPGHAPNLYSVLTESFFRAWALVELWSMLVLDLTNTIAKALPSSCTVATREGKSRYEFLDPKYAVYVTSFVAYQNKF